MTDKHKNGSASYEKAGVNIEAGNSLVQNIKPFAQATRRPEIMDGIGGFNALFRVPEGYRSPVLVMGTDGVGTKLKVAMELNRHETIGIDLVAMCVNDLLCSGAEPLAFLDYYATGALDVATATHVVKGIAEGCIQAGCSLVGGETAEMPGMYQGSDYDLAGFCVGVVDGPNIINGEKIQVGDQLIGIASSGPHSNGYSLIRYLLDEANIDYNSIVQGHSIADTLLAPTRIYVKNILELCKQQSIKGIVHITGGGFQENIPRILPSGLGAKIDTASWQVPWVFNWLQSLGKISLEEMYRTFNMGIGLVLCVPCTEIKTTLNRLKKMDEKAWHIGSVISTPEVILE